MDEKRFPYLVKQLYGLVDELEAMFPGRHFTPDGHMVGSLGECLAAYYYGLDLLPASSEGRDALKDGVSVEIKATQGSQVALRCAPQHLLVLRLHRDGSFHEVYNGPGAPVWDCVRTKPLPRNGQYQISLIELERLMKLVPESERIMPIL